MNTAEYIGPCGCDEARDPWTRCEVCEASGWTPPAVAANIEAVSVEGPGHFVCADRCRFVRHHHVGRYCVSTVGDYRPDHSPDAPYAIGAGRTHETFVFDLEGADRWTEVQALAARSDEDAEATHAQGIEWARRRVSGG